MLVRLSLFVTPMRPPRFFARWVSLALFTLLLPGPARAQEPESAGPAARRPIIDTVIISRQDVFDSVEARNWLAHVANGLHVTTAQGVVRNELLFKAGEPYDSARVAETARNLRALGIFRDVRIDTLRTDSTAKVLVTTQDAWSTRLALSFRSTGNQIAFTVGANEGNLLGTGSQALLIYSKNPDRSSWQVGFARSRLIARRIGVLALYNDLSDGTAAQVTVAAPFYSLETRWGVGVTGRSFSGRIFQYTNGQPVPSDTLQRRFAQLQMEAAYAPVARPGGHLRLGLSGYAKRDDFVPQSSTGPIPSTVSGTFGPFGQATRPRFLVVRNFLGFKNQEDVDISSTVRVGAYVALQEFGYVRSGVGPALIASTGTRLPSGFAIFSGRASGLYSSAGLDSGSAIVAGTVVFQPGLRHMILLHGDGGWQRDPAPGDEFDLGLGIGPRAFPAHAFTGNRAFYGTAEYRWILTEEFLSVMGIGLAAFGDYGGAWFDGTPSRTGTDFGVGLRLGPSRVAGEPPLRIDLAYRLANDVEGKGWVVVIQKGFPFAALRFDQF